MPNRFSLFAKSAAPRDGRALPAPLRRDLAPLLTVLLAIVLAAPSAAAERPAIYPVDEIRAGLTGVMTTVLEGNEREELALEIVGVQRDALGPGLPIILCRLTGERGRFNGVAAGMSGSPVTVDGRLVGALSYSIGTFNKEPLCGITPIEQMLALESLPAGGESASDAPASVAGLSRIPSLITVSGLGLGSEDAVRSALEAAFPDTPFRVAGQAANAVSHSAGAAPLVAGDPIAALLVWGDVKLGAVGTITWRDGSTFLAFGHPYLGIGRAALPAARAEVVWTVASEFSSYKISNVGDPVGVVTQDRLTGLVGELGPAPKGLPLDVTVRRPGRPERKVSTFLIEDRYLAPTLAGIVVQQVGYGGAATERDEMLSMRATIELDDGRSVAFDAIDSGPSGGVRQSFGGVLGARLAPLMTPPIELPPIARIDVTIDVAEREGGWSLASALPDRIAARSGDTIRVRARLEGPKGATRDETLELEVPSGARAGEYVLLTGSALALEGELGSLGVARLRTARTAEDLLAGLADSGSATRLESRLVQSAEGIVTRGREYPALPGTAHGLLRARTGGEEAYRSRWHEYTSVGIDLDRTVSKLVRTKIRILPADERR